MYQHTASKNDSLFDSLYAISIQLLFKSNKQQNIARIDFILVLNLFIHSHDLLTLSLYHSLLIALLCTCYTCVVALILN